MRYLQLDASGHVQAEITYSTPPVGYHAALAQKQLHEAENETALLPVEEREKRRGYLAQLAAQAEALMQQEADFLAAWAREGLVLVAVPPTEDLSDMYEELEPGKPEKGVRVRPAFQAKARTWPRLEGKAG